MGGGGRVEEEDGGGFPGVVTVDLGIRELMDVDHVDSTFTIDFVMTTRWCVLSASVRCRACHRF